MAQHGPAPPYLIEYPEQDYLRVTMPDVSNPRHVLRSYRYLRRKQLGVPEDEEARAARERGASKSPSWLLSLGRRQLGSDVRLPSHGSG
jgi:hypothetical protein